MAPNRFDLRMHLGEVYADMGQPQQALAELDAGLATAELSMGMSGDLEIAVEEGATLVRVGTALFGERTDSPRPQRSN